MRIHLLKQIESGEATDNVRRSIKEGERLKNFYKQTFLNIEPRLASQGQTKDTIVEGSDAIIQRLGRYLDSNEAERAKLASERAKKKGIQQIQESTAQALGEPITQPTSIQKAVEEGIAKIQQAAVEKTAEAAAKSPSVLGMWNESQALYEADKEKEQQRKREEKQQQAAIEMEEFKSQLRREELQLQRELNQESLRSLVDQARDSINQAVQEGTTRIQDSTQSHEDAILGIQRAANQAIKDIKSAKEYYSKSGVSDASTNTPDVPPQPLSYQPPATITADDLLPELPVVPSASPRTPVLDAEELRRRLEKLQEETPIMDLKKLRGEVERLEPSQSVTFTELPGAPAVPQESPGPREAGGPRVVGPRRRQVAMRFGPQPMPQAPKPPPPTAPTPYVASNPSRSFISFTDPKFIFPPPEEIPQIKASDILPQAPTPPPPVPPPLPKSPFIFSSKLQPSTPEAQFQSVSLPQSPFCTAHKGITDAMVNYRNKLLEHVKILEELEEEEEEEEEEGEEWDEEARRELFGEGRAQRGQGIKYFNSPAQLFDRLELLAGSISAGNNGVANEFTEIAHVLRNMGILTQTALNKLLRKFILGK